MTEGNNKLHVRGHYSEKEINDKLEWSISLLHELVVSIDGIDHGYTLQKAERINTALNAARDALGIAAPGEPRHVTREEDHFLREAAKRSGKVVAPGRLVP